MKPTDPKPWLAPHERVLFVIHCISVACLLAIVLWLAPGCEFVAEGEPLVGCDDCYRPPHFDGARITGDPPEPPDGSSSSISETGPDELTESSADDSGTAFGDTSGNPTESDGSSESSSTGEPAEYEPAHCDMSCPAGDALQPSEAQAGGTFPGCYCATPCESDDDCGGAEHCEPFFGRCTVWCMGDADCTPFDIPGSMACTLWWDDAEHFVHFCSYWNEDAP